nr:zinc finger BED domain-containing protein DAYSLEEPER-like [Ipomoea batatas]
MVYVCDEEEREVNRQAAPGSCPSCGGKVQAVDIEAKGLLCCFPICLSGPDESHKSFSAFSPPATAATPPSHLQPLPSSRLSSFIFSESPASAALNPSLTLSTSGPDESHKPLSAFSAFSPPATAASPPLRLPTSSSPLQPLIMNMKKGDSLIKKMACRMKIKFDKYWEQYSVILAMRAALDQRMKYKLLEFCYKKLDKSTYKEKLDAVNNKLYMLFEAYKVTSLTAKTSSTITTSRCENLVAMEASDDFDMDMKPYASLNILNFWKDNKHRFGELSLMACDVLSIPITIVASESTFSIGGSLLNKYMNCLLSSNVQVLICTRNWLSGFELDDKGDDGGVEDVHILVSTEFSEA